MEESLTSEEQEALAIVDLAYRIDGRAQELYTCFADTFENESLREFWISFSEDEKSHLDFWDNLREIGKTTPFTMIVDDPAGLLDFMRDSLAGVEAVLAEAREHGMTASQAFLEAYRLEMHMLDPAFQTLFQSLRFVQSGFDPVEEYESHIASFIRGMREFGSHTPESELLASTLDKLWHDNLRLASQALTDSLTGLLNRRGFLALSSQICALMRRSGSPVGVLMLDVDRFKSINDRFGHKRGDEILALVARALESSLRESDLVGRYGGDEFVVLMPDIANPEQIARKVADTINRTLYDSCDLSVSVGASGGLIDSASVSQSLEGLISEADVALYRAKRDGGRSVSR